MVHRYRGGVVPRDPQRWATPMEQAGTEALAAYARAMNALDIQEGAAQFMALAARANRYVEETAPWKLAKEGRTAELDSVLANLVRTVARLAVLAAPFLPEKAAASWELLGTGRPVESTRLADLTDPAVEELVVHKPGVLFPKPAPV